jgi:hypothetical protein
MATMTSGRASATSSRYKIYPFFTAMDKGPSIQMVSAPLIMKRPIKSVAEVSSWQLTVTNVLFSSLALSIIKVIAIG